MTCFGDSVRSNRAAQVYMVVQQALVAFIAYLVYRCVKLAHSIFVAAANVNVYNLPLFHQEILLSDEQFQEYHPIPKGIEL